MGHEAWVPYRHGRSCVSAIRVTTRSSAERSSSETGARGFTHAPCLVPHAWVRSHLVEQRLEPRLASCGSGGDGGIFGGGHPLFDGFHRVELEGRRALRLLTGGSHSQRYDLPERQPL